MIISKKYKLLYVDIMRCASTSLHKIITDLDPEAIVINYEPPYRKEAPIEQIEKEIDLQDYFKFCIVRNPWDWMVSKYLFHQKSGRHGVKNKTFEQWVNTDEALHACYQIPILNFHDYIRRTYETEKRIITNYYVDVVYNFHCMPFIENQLSEFTNTQLSIPKLNEGKEYDYQQFYKSGSIQKRVAQRYSWAIDKFEWTFGERSDYIKCSIFWKGRETYVK